MSTRTHLIDVINTQNRVKRLWFPNVPNGTVVEMMGLIGAGNNPEAQMTVAVAVAVEEAMK